MTAAQLRAMSDRDAAGRALGDLAVGLDVDMLPVELHAAVQEYSDLALLEDLTFAADAETAAAAYLDDLAEQAGTDWKESR